MMQEVSCMPGFMRFEECESLNVCSALHTVTLTKSDSLTFLFVYKSKRAYNPGQHFLGQM